MHLAAIFSYTVYTHLQLNVHFLCGNDGGYSWESRGDNDVKAAGKGRQGFGGMTDQIQQEAPEWAL